MDRLSQIISRLNELVEPSGHDYHQLVMGVFYKGDIPYYVDGVLDEYGHSSIGFDTMEELLQSVLDWVEKRFKDGDPHYNGASWSENNRSGKIPWLYIQGEPFNHDLPYFKYWHNEWEEFLNEYKLPNFITLLSDDSWKSDHKAHFGS